MALREVQLVLRQVYEPFLGKWYFKYINYIWALAGAAAVFGLLLLGYYWYMVHREQAAQKALAEYVQEYKKIITGSPELSSGQVESLSRVIEQFEYGYNRYKKTRLAPYFLAFQVDALLRQGNKDQARLSMRVMLEQLPVHSPLFTLYKTKYALMLLDSDDEQLRQTGIDELTALALNKQNYYRDVALFYLGRYYWAHDNLAEAKKIWQELIDQEGGVVLAPSPWIQEAKIKLDQIGV